MMADEVENIEENEENEQDQAVSTGSGKGLLIAFVGLVVLLETACSSSWFPVPNKSAPWPNRN